MANNIGVFFVFCNTTTHCSGGLPDPLSEVFGQLNIKVETSLSNSNEVVIINLIVPFSCYFQTEVVNAS